MIDRGSHTKRRSDLPQCGSLHVPSLHPVKILFLCERAKFAHFKLSVRWDSCRPGISLKLCIQVRISGRASSFLSTYSYSAYSNDELHKWSTSSCSGCSSSAKAVQIRRLVQECAPHVLPTCCSPYIFPSSTRYLLITSTFSCRRSIHSADTDNAHRVFLMSIYRLLIMRT